MKKILEQFIGDLCGTGVLVVIAWLFLVQDDYISSSAYETVVSSHVNCLFRCT